MITEIILYRGWRKLVQYDTIFSMAAGDIVKHEGEELTVTCCLFQTSSGIMQIIVKD